MQVDPTESNDDGFASRFRRASVAVPNHAYVTNDTPTLRT